ncbi:syntaxin-8 [Sitophilus oryzae]|uniref:Syntaxin-8 n=1 Tax=Sitophilus oryzae TaxID=7048 RepID=A0A6J2X5S7_SITOR|nr:syntaxin-8 [Sitophilus oryzae]
MALLFLGEDTWLLEHESCEKLQREIMEQLTERQQYPRNSDKYGQISATIRFRLKQFNSEVQQLKSKLDTSVSSITPAESERRSRQIEVLQTKSVHMKKIFDDQVSMKAMQERRNLLSDTDSEWASASAGTSENLSVDELKARQQRMLGEQDTGLENLSKIISRQKDIAAAISNEVDFHNEIIEDIGTQIDRTDTRVRTETSHVGLIDRKDNTCGYWIVIIILFISIIVVVSLK